MRKQRRRIGIAIDMTPMVDIAFLLLIFFMCTTQFKPPEKDKITLPDSSSPAKSPESNIITISITAAPTVKVIYRKGGEEVTQELDPATIQSTLGAALKTARAANPAARVLLKMDKDATYGVMADMITGLQEANATRFNVQTNLKGGAGAFGSKAQGEEKP